MDFVQADVSGHAGSQGIIIKSPGVKDAGRPEEVPGLVFFQVSDESDFTTGQNYIIDEA